jgi:hypothetical protein
METTHSLRKPVESRHAGQRNQTLALGVFLVLGIALALVMIIVGCGGGSSVAIAPPVASVQPLQVADVQNIAQAAVNSVNVDMAVAVVDRAGFVLGVFRTQNAPKMRMTSLLRWRGPARFSATIRRRSRREQCDSSAEFTFLRA